MIGYYLNLNIQKANYQELYEYLIKVNNENDYFRSSIGLEDMKLFVRDAKHVSLDIEY